MPNPKGNPDIVEVGKKTQFTKENAREMQARSVDARNAFTERKRILLSKAKLSDESKKFWASIGFEGDDLAFVTNDMKLQEKGIKRQKKKATFYNLSNYLNLGGLYPKKKLQKLTKKKMLNFLLLG